MNRRSFIQLLGLAGLSRLINCGGNVLPEADIVVLYPTNTISAYDLSRGSNLYHDLNIGGRASRDRVVPYLSTGSDKRADGFIDWLNKRNDKHRFRFISDKDMEVFNNIEGAKLLIVIGHSEYWTRQARLNLDHFIALGGNLAWLSADMGWQVRYKDNDIVCYKNGNEDPESNSSLKTILWNLTDYKVEYTLGASYEYGGMRATGYHIIDKTSPIFKGIDKDFIPHKAYEFDGLPKYTLKTGIHNGKILAYGEGEDYDADPLVNFFPNSEPKIQVIVDYKRNSTSGRVINVCSISWCEDLTGDLGIITDNIINELA